MATLGGPDAHWSPLAVEWGEEPADHDHPLGRATPEQPALHPPVVQHVHLSPVLRPSEPSSPTVRRVDDFPAVPRESAETLREATMRKRRRGPFS